MRHLPGPYPFFVETCTPVVAAPATVLIGAKGGQPPRLLIFSAGPTAAGSVAVSSPSPWLPAVSHPDIYMTGFLATLVMPGDSLSLAVPAIPPMNLVVQAACFDPVISSVALSTPGTLVIR
jgi:hypothetical protein